MDDRPVELLLDDTAISWSHNLERRLCQPVKHPDNPLLVPEHAWESCFMTMYGSVLPAEDGAGWRMWYMAGAGGSRADQMLCYAESDDGVDWRRPLTRDGVPYDGTERTNILLGPDPNIHGPCVIRNAHDSAPDERYLLLYDSYSRYRPDAPEVQRPGVVIADIYNSRTAEHVSTGTVTIYSGSDGVHDPPARLHLTRQNVWNNGGDYAFLHDAGNQKVDRFTYP